MLMEARARSESSLLQAAFCVHRGTDTLQGLVGPNDEPICDDFKDFVAKVKALLRNQTD